MNFPNVLFFPILLLACVNNPARVLAQASPGATSAGETAKAGSQLFDTEDVLHFSLAGRLSDLYKDVGDNMEYHPFLLQYRRKDSSLVSIQLKIKTRGHFRRMKENCNMPPLLLDFADGATRENTLFENQTKLKLVVPCKGDDYVIREYLIYKLYNLISPRSFRARLALVEFEDSTGRKKTETHYCFLLEDEKEMAERNQLFVWKKTKVPMQKTSPVDFNRMAVFEYMIGNTDWGVPYLQNIVLVTKDSLKAPVTVPYDFDLAGIVSAPYAAAAPELNLSSVQSRLYRGFCEEDMNNFQPAFDLFNRLKPDFYKVYTSCSLLDARYLKFVTRYLDDFYKTINDEKSAKKEFEKPCRMAPIEIQGLKKRASS